MGIWLERARRLLIESSSPTVTVRGSDWGLPLVLARIREDSGLGWIEATNRLQGDVTAQGNALAAALNAATGTKLFPQGLAFEVHLSRLARYSQELTPIHLALTSAAHAPELLRALLTLLPEGVHLLLDFDNPGELPEGLAFLPAETFRLNPEQALQIAPSSLSPDTVLADLERAGGLRPAFVNLMNARLGLPPASQPGAEAPLRQPGDAELHTPNLVIAALMRQKRFEEALELAVQAAPRLVERILPRAGPEFQRRGQLERLHLLLSSLDEPWSDLESTLEWRLVAGVDVGDFRDLLPVIDEYLEDNPAPDLRARRAALLSPERRQSVAHAALLLARTPLTLWQAGRMSKDLDSAITLLHESVRLAEDSGSAYDVVRNAGSLAETYLHAGELRQSLHWSDWALSMMDEAEIGDGLRRTRIMNNLAVASMLTGETLGMRRKLEDVLDLAAAGGPDVVANTSLTLATLCMVEGDMEAALGLMASARATASRRQLAQNSYQRLVILLEAGQTAAAAREVEQASAFAAGEDPLVRDSADLGRGMLLALAEDRSALRLLEPLVNDAAASLEQRLTAWLYLRLVTGPSAAVPDGLRVPLAQVAPSGLRMLSAPASVFQPVWDELSGGAAELELKVLGPPRARLAGKEVKLTRRLWEVLLVIALNPAGIGDEQLLDTLVGDSQEFGLSALRTHVSRLRQLVPVSDTPYRLLVSNSLDLTQLVEAVTAGELRQALGLARGPVLPASRAAGIEEIRADTQALLEQAVLHSRDAEVVYSLAEELSGDIGLWERSRELLPPSDTRRAVATARIERLRQSYS